MKILNVIKCEFIKNYTLKKIISSLVVLLLSVIVSVELIMGFSFSNDEDSNDYSIAEMMYQSTKKEVEKNPTLENEFYLYYWKLSLEEKVYPVSEPWKNKIVSNVIDLDCKTFIINQLVENPSYSFDLEKSCGNYACVVYKNSLKEIKESKVPLEELKEQYEEEKNSYKRILEENKYYRYIEYLLEKNEYTEKKNPGVIYDNIDEERITKKEYQKYYQMIVDQKLESFSDYRVQNIFLRMEFYMDTTVYTLKEFTRSNISFNYSNYNSYLRERKVYRKLEKEYTAILDYSILHQKSQDSLLLDTGVFNYVTSKTVANLVLRLGIVILLLVIVTSGGIVSGEHATKTDKMLLTEPISRAKVILGKFIYLVLHTYILWIAAFLLIYFYAGFRFGFHELLTPKLVYFNGHVIEVNYILHMLLQILICEIPLLPILSIMLLLSVTTFSTVITNFVSMLLSFYSVLVGTFIPTLYSIFGSGTWMKFMEYTPFLYVDQEFMLKSGYTYLRDVGIINVSPLKGIIISIFAVLIALSLTIFLYRKRDIKN